MNNQKRPHIQNTFSRDTNQSFGVARSKDEGVLEARRVRSDKASVKDWLYPEGLRIFFRTALLRLGRSMSNTPPSPRPADTGKSLATRLERISEMGSMSKNVALALSLFLIVLGAVSRLLPHMANFTPVTAIALAASVYLGLRYSLAVILAVMLMTDAIIGFYSWQIMLAVYGSFALSGLLGFFIQKHKRVATVFLGTLGSSLIFFLITNWAVWQFGALYPRSFAGLTQSYLMALPFLKNSLAGDLVYTGLLFGVFELSLYLAKKGASKKAAPVYQ